jgi:hypothetical protein
MNNTLHYTDDEKDIKYTRGEVEYLIPSNIYENYSDHIISYNTHLFFTITLDPKYKNFKQDITHQKQLIDSTIDKHFKSYNYIYTYELQNNGNLHVHGFLLTDYISDSKKTLLRRDVRADLTNHYDRKGVNRIIDIQKPKDLVSTILYTLKEMKDPLYYPTKKVIKRSDKQNIQNKSKFFKILKQEEQSSDSIDQITISFD